MGLVFEMLGGLVPTYLLSRLFLWLTKRFLTGIPWLIVSHIASLILTFVLAALGNADGGPLKWDAGILYIIPQMVWFVFDIIRNKAKKPT
jgi:hypothetical protein